MKEHLPIGPEVEESWNNFLDRFDKLIFPTIFEPKEISYATALMIWTLTDLNDNIKNVSVTIDELHALIASRT